MFFCSKLLSRKVCFVAIAFLLTSTSSFAEPPTKTIAPKNIILMIGDGMGPAQIKAYRLYKDNLATAGVDPITLDAFLVGTLATEPAAAADADDHVHSTYIVTDSAASATAYSTGQRTYNGAVGVDLERQPMSTVLEQAKQVGKKVGLVATSQIVHATPASFIAHVDSRRKYNDIADAFVDNQLNEQPLLDVFLGGGWRYFKRDDRDLTKELQSFGYQIVRTRQELLTASKKVAGLFAEVALSPAIDRTDDEPSLKEMTEAAISRLDNPQGFFLMVEGSQIDWSGHANDIAGVVNEMDDFHQAIQAAIAFAEKDGDTLVIVTADHETGGLSIGRNLEKKSVYAYNVAPIKGLEQSLPAYQKEILATRNNRAFLQHSGIELTDDEQKQWKEISKKLEKEAVWQWLVGVMSRATLTGWTTNGHTGVDVNIYAFGPGATAFYGYHDNTHVGQAIRRWLTPK